MKIISQLPEDKVLVSLDRGELANILGEYSKFDIKKEVLDELIIEGTNISISDIYSKHRLIHGIQHSSDYNTARRKLEEMLSALTPIENKIAALSDLSPLS